MVISNQSMTIFFILLFYYMSLEWSFIKMPKGCRHIRNQTTVHAFFGQLQTDADENFHQVIIDEMSFTKKTQVQEMDLN